MRKKIFGALLALCLVPCLAATTVYAATYTVGNGPDLTNKFNNYNDKSDPVIILELTCDIDYIGLLQSREGFTYTISGKEYVIKSVVPISGSGTVTVDADIDSSNYGLIAMQSTDVTVNGNITANYDGIRTTDDSNVTVNGDIEADGSGVIAMGDSEVTVNGDVTGDEGFGVIASGKSSSIETADYYGDDDTSSEEHGANVTVNGDVTGNVDGVVASDSADVTVNGDVTATGDGNYGSGVVAADDATVEVTGDVNGVSTGVYAFDSSDVTVGGDVYGGDGIADEGDEDSEAGTGVVALDSADVSVGGSVYGGDSDSESLAGGTGVYMESTANVSVDGDVMGGDDKIEAASGSVGAGGAGAIIFLTPKSSNDDETATSGALYVKGTISGGEGTGEYNIPGEGIVYETANDSVLNITDELMHPESVAPYYRTIQEMAEKVRKEGKSFCNNILPELNYSEENIASFLSDYNKSLKNLLLGKVNNDESYWDEAAGWVTDSYYDKVNEIDPDSRSQLDFKLDLISNYNDFVAGFVPTALQLGFEETYIPEVTTWKVESGGENASAVDSVSEILAAALNAEHNYIVKIADTSNGTVSVDKDSYKPGETVTITAKPNAGYKLSKVMVNGEEITPEDGVYSFEMAEYGGVEVSAEFVPDGSNADNADNADNANNSSSTSSTAPDTGDSSNMTLWIAVLIACLGAACVAAKKKFER